MLDAATQVCRYIRVVPAIEENGSVFFYWAVYAFASFTIATLICCLAYIACCVSRNHFPYTWPVHYLRETLLIAHWVLVSPFCDIYLSIFKCKNDFHKIDTSIKCYGGLHIFLIVLSLVLCLLLVSLTAAASLFHREILLNENDASARLEDSSTLLLSLYRVALSVCAIFATTVFFLPP